MIRYFKLFYDRFKDYLLLIFLLLVSLVCLSLNNNESVKAFRAFSFGYYAFINSIPNYISEVFNNDAELNRLRQRNAELMLRVNLLRQQGLDYQKLKKLESYSDTSNFELIPSKIISKLVTKSNGVYILNKGFSDSVSVGMPVINDEGFIGLVTNVSQNFCVLKTILNVNSRFTVNNQRSNLDGILAWNGQDLIIKNIPTTFDFQIGDRINISEFSVVAPPNVPVGYVFSKEKTAAGLLSNIIVKPYVDFNSLSHIFIINTVPSKEIENLELNLFK